MKFADSLRNLLKRTDLTMNVDDLTLKLTGMDGCHSESLKLTEMDASHCESW